MSEALEGGGELTFCATIVLSVALHLLLLLLVSRGFGTQVVVRNANIFVMFGDGYDVKGSSNQDCESVCHVENEVDEDGDGSECSDEDVEIDDEGENEDKDDVDGDDSSDSKANVGDENENDIEGHDDDDDNMNVVRHRNEFDSEDDNPLGVGDNSAFDDPSNLSIAFWGLGGASETNED